MEKDNDKDFYCSDLPGGGTFADLGGHVNFRYFRAFMMTGGISNA